MRSWMQVIVDITVYICVFFFFKRKTAYEMRISDWSSDVCSSDLKHRAMRNASCTRGCSINVSTALSQSNSAVAPAHPSMTLTPDRDNSLMRDQIPHSHQASSGETLKRGLPHITAASQVAAADH